jgi:hypothetical protein
MLGGEAVDLDGDGLLEFYEIARNSGSGQPPKQAAFVVAPDTPPDADSDRVYWNTGRHGGAANHWLRVRLTGMPERKLLGSRIYAYDRATRRLLGRRDYTTTDSYKMTHEAWAHFGLGATRRVDVWVDPPHARMRRFKNVRVDGVRVLNMSAKRRRAR